MNQPFYTADEAAYWEKRRIADAGNFAGFGIVLMLALSYGYSNLLQLINRLFPAVFQSPLMTNDWMDFVVFDFVPYVLMIGVPFVVASWITHTPIRPFSRHQRVPIKTAFPVLLVGFGGFVIANLLTDGVVFVWSGFGLPVPDLSSDQDGSARSFLLTLFSTAVLPALLEEMSFRGILLERLRPLGDRFAVVISALLFGLAHGNIVQIPFAFLLGLLFGYIVVRTNNIWLAVLLHFLNNGMSVMFEYVRLVNPSVAGAVQVTWFMLMLLAGTVAMLVLYRRPHRFFAPLGTVDSPISPSHRNTMFWSTPFMIAALVLMALRFIDTVITRP